MTSRDEPTNSTEIVFVHGTILLELCVRSGTEDSYRAAWKLRICVVYGTVTLRGTFTIDCTVYMPVRNRERPRNDDCYLP